MLGVVYLLTPTSNHNYTLPFSVLPELYIFWLLHQTTTWYNIVVLSGLLYIFWLLHQTTTLSHFFPFPVSCISFDSYIKPQLKYNLTAFPSVVYLLTPTSNHNPAPALAMRSMVVYLLTPTSNHNLLWAVDTLGGLYIFWLLHQTTTERLMMRTMRCCISFDSYIKPQPAASALRFPSVVYLLTPTSNHNLWIRKKFSRLLYIFWLLHQTTTCLRY